MYNELMELGFTKYYFDSFISRLKKKGFTKDLYIIIFINHMRKFSDFKFHTMNMVVSSPKDGKIKI